MKHVLSKIVILTVIIAMAFSFSSLAATSHKGKGNHRALKGSTDVSKILAYSFADEKAQPGTVGPIESSRIPIGSVTLASSSASPGLFVGYTWYDYQHNGSMGRMIDVGPHVSETGYAIVHMGWMYLPEKMSMGVYRSYAYSAYTSENHALTVPVYLQEEGVGYGGYVNVDVTMDNRAVVGGHNNEGAGTQPHFYFDGGPAYATFPNEERIPDSVASYDQTSSFDACWPKFFFQYGTDTVFHAVAEISEIAAPQMAILYYRKAGFEGSDDYEWDFPPYIVDSVSTLAHDIVGQKLGDRVAMAWTANLPYQEPECDTCSGFSEVYNGYPMGQMDNDIYYQQSFDQGLTWQPRVNLTQVPIGEAGYKAYADLSMIYDSQGSLHLAWTACPWPADLCINEGGFCWEDDWYIDNARLFHWSENIPYNRVIADQVYEVGSGPMDSCSVGAWGLRIAKPTLSECDGRLFTIWTQFNDPDRGIIDDCAEWGYDEGSSIGAANGDIYFASSADWGMTWSDRVNLTDSYAPHCDPKFGEDCQNDYWASMNRNARAVEPMEDWTGVIVVDPSGGAYAGDYYLDIMYINDLDAGAIAQDEGSWTNNPVKWFRIPCIDLPPPPQCPFVSPESIGDPFYVLAGESYDTAMFIENISAISIDYTVSIEEDGGPAGWLGISGLSGTVPSGLGGLEEGTIHLNQGGIISTFGNYYGRIVLDFPTIPCTRTIEIELIVVGGPTPQEIWDTVNTECLSLTVSTLSNMGNMAEGKVNMDFHPEDCDTTAQIYMFDGSLLVGRIIGDDTVFNWAVYGTEYWDDEGFRSQGGSFASTYCAEIDAEVFQSGIFTTQDSLLAMEKTWVAPQSDCNFIIEYLRMWSYDGTAHEDIMIGEGVDWDVPWDYLATDTYYVNGQVNIGGVDGIRNLVYQQGYEAYGLGSDTGYPYNCQYNDARFAGNAFIESYMNGTPRYPMPYSGFVNELDVIQTGNGFEKGLLYQEMMMSGMRATDSLEDLATFMCYEPTLDLGGTDVYAVASILVTIQDGNLSDLQAAVDDAVVWYNLNGGVNMFSDGDDDGQIDICEGCCVTMGNFYNDGSPFNILDLDNWIAWMLRDPGVPAPPDCPTQLDIRDSTVCVMAGDICIYPDGQIDIIDLDAWVDCLLRGEGPCPTECPDE